MIYVNSCYDFFITIFIKILYIFFGCDIKNITTKEEVKTLDTHFEYTQDTQTLIGTQKKRLQDIDTGEYIEVDQITKRAYGQKQFWKIYLLDFLQVLGILDSKQIDVLIYILENTNASNNTFIGSQRKIATQTNVSLQTVSRILVKLQDNNFIKKIQNGVYQVSPNILMKGSDHKKSLLLNYYQENITDSTEKQEV